jgi:hypothetical protein
VNDLASKLTLSMSKPTSTQEGKVAPAGATERMVNGSEREDYEVLEIVAASQNPAFLRQQSSLHQEYSSNGFDVVDDDDDDVELGLEKTEDQEDSGEGVANPKESPTPLKGPRLVFMRPEPFKQEHPNTTRSTPGAHSVSGMSSHSNLVLDEISIGSNEGQMHLVEAQLVAVEDDDGIDDAPKMHQDEPDQDILQAEPVPESKFVRHFTCCGRDITVNLFVNAIFLALVLGFIVALSFALSSSSAENVSALMPSPTSPSNQESQNETRFDSLRSFLSGTVTVNGALFDDPETPQYKALDWLANKDLAEVSMVKQGDDRVIQRYVLAVLYFSTGGPDWEYSLNFLHPEHECDWKGTDELGNEKGVLECVGLWGAGVSNLQLYWNNLTGTIPDEIGVLGSLRTLALGINHLHGSIPAKFPMDLNQLFLNDNNFTGTVPMELGSLTNLDLLAVYSNPDLTGNLDFLCQRHILWFVTDCGGMNPTVECACCSHCCDQEAKECCEVEGRENSTDSCWDPTPIKGYEF